MYKGPLKDIPQEFINKFTLNNTIPLYNYWFDGTTNNTTKIIWDTELIRTIRQKYTRNNIINNNLFYNLNFI